MNAEIISVGSELLLGQISNTNAQFLSKELALLGINVYYHSVVGDNSDRLKNTIKLAQERSDLIIFTGGLGPTKDDLTKETVAEILGKELIYNENALSKIEGYFKRVKRVMTANNRKQALVIKDCSVLENKTGMAPGIVSIQNEKIFMLLPGPPKELQPMFLGEGKSFLYETGKISEYIMSRSLRFFGIGESQLEEDVEDLIMKQTNPTIATLAGESEAQIRLTAKSTSEEEAVKLLDACEQTILGRKNLNKFFYGYDDTSLPVELSKLLESKGFRLACAESLTGGMFAQYMTEITGAGTVFKGGIISYSNEVKENLVGVSKKTIDEHGVVSSQCAEKMAEQIRIKLNADVGISFTGVAGPAKSEGKEVGTVFIGISIKDRDTIVYPLNLVGSRNIIRKRSAFYGFYYLLMHLKEG